MSFLEKAKKAAYLRLVRLVLVVGLLPPDPRGRGRYAWRRSFFLGGESRSKRAGWTFPPATGSRALLGSIDGSSRRLLSGSRD